jgi:hypothetical protein
MEMPVSPSDCLRLFKELCDRLKRSDPTLLKVDNIHVLPKSGYGRRLGVALQRNAVVTELHLRLNGLLCPKHVQTSQTHNIMLILKFIRDSPSLRKVKVTTTGGTMDELSLTQWILEAMAQNPSLSALNLDVWDLPAEILTHFLDTRPRLVSLELNGSICYEVETDAQDAGRALAKLESLKTLKFTIQEHMDVALLPMVGHGALCRLHIRCSGGHYGVEGEFDSLAAMLGRCANLQHLALEHFSLAGAQGILLVQGLHDRASSCSILPLKSVTLDQCHFDAEASAAWFPGNESSGTEGQELPSSTVWRGIHALKLSNCNFDVYSRNGHSFPNLSGFLAFTNLASFVLIEKFCRSWIFAPLSHQVRRDLFFPNTCPSHFLSALRRNGSLCRLTIRSLSGKQIPWRNVRRRVQAIMTRNKQILQILAKMGGKNGDGCVNNELELLPTLFVVAVQACRTAPNSLLTGLLAIGKVGPHMRKDGKRSLVSSAF